MFVMFFLVGWFWGRGEGDVTGFAYTSCLLFLMLETIAIFPPGVVKTRCLVKGKGFVKVRGGASVALAPPVMALQKLSFLLEH